MGQDLAHWNEEDPLPAVFAHLDSVFSGFGWVKGGAKGWKTRFGRRKVTFASHGLDVGAKQFRRKNTSQVGLTTSKKVL